MTLEVEFDRRGVELLAVVEGHALADLKQQRLVVTAPFVAGGQLRHEVELLVEVEELVAQAGEDDAADEGARQARIEDVEVLGQADTQGLGLRGCGGKAGGQGQRQAQTTGNGHKLHAGLPLPRPPHADAR